MVEDGIFSLLLDVLGSFSTEVGLNRVILGIFSNFGLLAGKDAQLIHKAGFVGDSEAPS